MTYVSMASLISLNFCGLYYRRKPASRIRNIGLTRMACYHCRVVLWAVQLRHRLPCNRVVTEIADFDAAPGLSGRRVQQDCIPLDLRTVHDDESADLWPGRRRRGCGRRVGPAGGQTEANGQKGERRAARACQIHDPSPERLAGCGAVCSRKPRCPGGEEPNRPPASDLFGENGPARRSLNAPDPGLNFCQHLEIDAPKAAGRSS